MAKDDNHLFIILAIIGLITCCNGIIVAAGSPGILIDKKKYLKPDGAFLSLSDVSKNILVVVCFLSIPLLVGFIFFYSYVKKSFNNSGSHGDEDEDED